MDPTHDEPLKFAIRHYEIHDPASRAGLLLAQVNSAAGATRINSLTMQAIGEDARGLVTADLAGSHSVLGALAALHGRYEEVRVHYRIALEHAGQSAVSYLNYSIALLQVGDSVKAYRMALEAVERAPECDAVLPHLVMTAFEAGHFRETLAHCESWRTFHPQERLPHCGPAQTITDAIDRGTLSEEATAKALRAANRVRGAASVRPAATALYQDMRQPGGFRYRIDIHATRGKAQDLSAAVAARIAETERGAGAPENGLHVIFVAV